MEKIEYTVPVQFGETAITEISVAPLTFVTFAGLWSQVANEARGKENVSAAALMQRKRIMTQAHFSAAGKRVVPDNMNITQLPIAVVKQIISKLDIGEGEAGKMLNDGDGISVPAHYGLGTPIEILMNQKKTTLSELEFKAEVYGDIEDVLAEDGDVPQALALIRKVATPVGLNLSSLPSWALDRLSVADGVTIMRQVLPRFLE